MEWTFSNAWTSDMCSEIHTLIDFLYLMPLNSMRYFFISDKFQEVNMNGRLNKVAMTAKLMQLKNELEYKCRIGELGEWECVGANKYLNRSLDILDEYWE